MKPTPGSHHVTHPFYQKARSMHKDIVVAIFGFLGVITAAGLSLWGLVITTRTRRENTEQHQASQSHLHDLTSAVGGLHEVIHDSVLPDIRETRDAVQEIAITVAVHDSDITDLKTKHKEP